MQFLDSLEGERMFIMVVSQTSGWHTMNNEYIVKLELWIYESIYGEYIKLYRANNYLKLKYKN